MTWAACGIGSSALVDAPPLLCSPHGLRATIVHSLTKSPPASSTGPTEGMAELAGVAWKSENVSFIGWARRDSVLEAALRR